MAFVATLVANPSNPVLTTALAEEAAAAVDASGLYWLTDGVACDIALKDGANPDWQEALLRGVIGDAPVDVVVQKAETRRKKLLIADMDSTMIGQECIDELAAEVGLKDKVADITARAMNGEIAFEPALTERVALLKGLPLSVVGDVIEKRITLTPGGLELVATMKAKGYYTALVSGGFTVFTGPIAAALGFNENRANILLEKRRPSHRRRRRTDPRQAGQGRCAGRYHHEAWHFDRRCACPSAMGPTISACCIWPAPASPCMPSPWSPRRSRSASTMTDLTALLYIQGYRKTDFVR
jgi:phosphoserine phosphatase